MSKSLTWKDVRYDLQHGIHDCAYITVLENNNVHEYCVNIHPQKKDRYVWQEKHAFRFGSFIWTPIPRPKGILKLTGWRWTE